MKKNLRESTTKKSNQLKEKLKLRKIEANKRKSRNLIKITDKNSDSISQALELSVYEQRDTTDSDIGNNSDTSAKDTVTEDNLSEPSASQEDYWYDTSNNELTGVEHSPVFPVSASNLEPDSWSPVNRFFPQGCLRSPPIVLNSKAASVPSSAPPFIQSSSVSPFEAVQVNSDSASAGSQSLPSPTLTVIMAIETFNNKFKEIKKLAANIQFLIDCYNSETVTLLDREDYKGELQKIQDKLAVLQVKVADLA